MLTVAGKWRNVAAEMTVVVTAVHPIPSWGHLLATTMNIVVTIVRAVHGRATDPAVQVHMDQAWKEKEKHFSRNAYPFRWSLWLGIISTRTTINPPKAPHVGRYGVLTNHFHYYLNRANAQLRTFCRQQLIIGLSNQIEAKKNPRIKRGKYRSQFDGGQR